ncbi:multidrug resistance protein homolog 49-like isoform X1 [Macrosteles quadrilineatus]|uniref:multidrug resistance protein homolog 49-like isoform X1 n=2 Tax=Macrosteles quadrilineatus TaxID=74068 RepID=UPI0023E1B1E2|nr:multidrug resistance protein homolog 49-like isoform X1 [Macrosteles quadrilineatus]
MFGFLSCKKSPVSEIHSKTDLIGSGNVLKRKNNSNEFESSTVPEQLLFLLGVLAAVFMGTVFPLLIVAYSEFLNLMIARQSADSIISNNYILQLFGGGSTNSSGTYEERMDRLLDDSLAFVMAQTSVAATMFACAVLSVYLLNYSAQKRVGRMRRHFLRAVLYQDISWHDTQNTGAFAAQLTDSLDKLQEGVGEKVGMFVYLVTTFVVSVIVAMFYGWKLALVMTAICPVFILVTVLVARVQTRLSAKEGESYGDAGAVVEEVLSNIRTVAAFGGEHKEVDRYNQKLIPARRVGIKSGIFSGFGGGVSWMLIFFSYSIAFWYGTPLILADRYNEDKTYTPGVLLIVLFGVVSGAMNLGFCTPHLEAFAKAKGGYNSVISILRRKPVINIDKKGVLLDSKLGEIEFKDVHFTYPARPDVKILKGLSLKVKKGESVAIVGGSGSGKSTTIQLIERFYDPQSGQISLNGVDLRTLDLRWVRAQIGLVGQEPVLFNTTITENICCDLKVTRAEMEEAAREANAHDFIMKLPAGYGTMVGERGAQLSGGQKQRIAIARALLRQPSILLPDEATSALDMANEAVVQSALERASRGRTTITISHRLSSIRNVDRILVLASGRLVEEGSHSELMEKKGHYYSLVTADASLQEASSPSNKDKLDTQTNEFIPLEEADVIPKETEKKEDLPEEDYNVPLLKIVGLNKPEWPYVLLGSVFSFLNGCISPVSAVFFGDMFWAYSSPDDSVILSAGNLYALSFVVLGIFAFICVFLQFSSLTLAGVRMTTRLRVNVFKAMLLQEMAWFDDERHSVGSLSARLSGDTSTIQGATGSKLGTLLQGVSTLGVGTLLSLYYSWKMTVVCLICIPFILFSILLESRVMHSEDSIEKKALGDATKIAVEAISSVRTVQSLGQENAVLERYTRRLLEAEESLRRKTRFRGVVFGLGQTSACIAYGFSLGYGGYLIAREGASYRNINIVAEALLYGAWMLAQAVSFAPSLNLAKIAAGRLFKILDRNPLIFSGSNMASLSWKAKGDIEYRDVHFSYPSRPDHWILQGLQLSIARGQKVALVGPSGCGKSTCVQLLQRFYDPVSGSLKIDSADSVDIPTRQLRAGLGIVSQEPVLFDRTIAENIAYGDNTRAVSMAEVVEAAKQANVHSFISSLPAGYETRLGSRGAQLSGGQKQRIAIARSLVRNPQILILDEATSALDSQSEKMVQEALDEASSGRTCIIIAHRLSTVTNADVICVLSRGAVVEMGSHAQLMANGGHYARQLLSQQ